MLQVFSLHPSTLLPLGLGVHPPCTSLPAPAAALRGCTSPVPTITCARTPLAHRYARALLLKALTVLPHQSTGKMWFQTWQKVFFKPTTQPPLPAEPPVPSPRTSGGYGRPLQNGARGKAEPMERCQEARRGEREGGREGGGGGGEHPLASLPALPGPRGGAAGARPAERGAPELGILGAREPRSLGAPGFGSPGAPA